MAESNRLVDLVQDRLDRFLTERASIFLPMGSDLTPFTLFSRQFLSGGKRFRALFCYWGFKSVRGGNSDAHEFDVVVGAASALEMFHAAALVHDDIIDHSDTRRAAPAAHKRFESLHADAEYAGNAAEFGLAAATLLGDLLLGYSDELLDDALEALAHRERARGVRGQFNRMRTEVTAGQYLDILEERAWVARSREEMIERAQRVIVYKSAKYSIESPLQIGALIAGATAGQRETLSEFGLPLGVAYQLRDDLLGVFGDSRVTGKPSGDDLREGKRTMLIALARRNLPASAARLLDELLGDPELDDDQVRMLQNAIIDSGAVAEMEALIRSNVAAANAALDEASLAPAAIVELRTLTQSVTQRVA